ncbi:MAG: DEAD/DEAH box helicase [Polyangiaceae bacterium]
MAADSLRQFQPAVREWFRTALGKPTAVQRAGFPRIADGKSALLLAPTGSGKTLAAFLAALDRLAFAPLPPEPERLRVLYVSPLKALAADVEKNLKSPIAGIARVAERLGMPCRELAVAMRTGDTPSKERSRFLRHPPDILITTPESLFLMLTSEARARLASVETVIVDEIHAMAGTKRGAHLFLSLERLEALREGRPPLQRVGLSATQRPLEEIAQLLAGAETRDGARVPREVDIVDCGAAKSLELSVRVTVDDMTVLPTDESGASDRSLWPAIYPHIVDAIRAHRSTMVFVNSRRLAERLAGQINEVAGEEIALAHHGSVSKEQRALIEDRLKSGNLPAIVATSSLELGIDMGAVDLVIQVEAPPSVASGMQRVGRAGHSVGQASKGVLFPKHRGDLLPTAAATQLMLAAKVEPTRYPRCPLDVLAQQLVAITAMDDIAADEAFALVTRAANFAELSRASFDGVLDMLSGRYPSDEFAELRPRITWDRVTGRLSARRGAKRLAVVNAGTIPDRGLYGVFLSDPERTVRVGELDEEMVFESRPGEVFVLGASSWRIEDITHDRVLVTPAPGEPGRMPFWHGDRVGRSAEFGRAVGALARTLVQSKPEQARDKLQREHGFDERAADNLLALLQEQREQTGVVPSDQTVIVERFVDEVGDFRVCVLSPFGARVHAPWALSVAQKARRELGSEVENVWSDDGIVFRFPEAEEPPPVELFVLAPEEIEPLMLETLGSSALFAARFRENAGRALLLPKRFPGKRSPLWAQRKRSADLLQVASRYGSFPILLETYRECLCDVFDLPALTALMQGVAARSLRVHVVDAPRPSAFSRNLLFGYVANFMYEGDAPLAERRAQALLLDQAQLRELLGQAELRQLFDADVIEWVARRVGRLDSAPLRDADGVHDLLLALGPLSEAEIRQRCHGGQSEAETRVDERLLEAGVRDSVGGRLSAAEIADSVDGRRVEAGIGDSADGRRAEAGIGDSADGRLSAAGIGERSRGRLSDAEGGERRPQPDFLDAWLRALLDARRILACRVGERDCYAAIEDASRLRDGLGVALPLGVPQPFKEPVDDPLGDLISRFARTHGPFQVEVLAAWFGIGPAVALETLRRLAARGRVAEGDFLPEGAGREWCGVEVLRQIKSRSLARLRKQVEPVSQELFAQFAQEWHGVTKPDASRDALHAAIDRLQGAPLPASELETRILPARVANFSPADLDIAFARGELVWRGLESVGPRDGRVALYPKEHYELLAPRPTPVEGAAATAIRAALAQRGALFFEDVVAQLGGFSPELLEALWDLVWAGEVTNDSLEPLRSRLRGERADRRARVRLGRRRRESPPGSEGRWSLLPAIAASETERRAALTESLLERWGVLPKEAARVEGIEGGFSAIYPILKVMEEAGKARRGYFVAGLGATQFARPGAEDFLRTLRDGSADGAPRVLAATDPANLYGAVLPFPAHPERPTRSVGAEVVLLSGKLVAYLARGGRALLTFLPEDEPERSACLGAAARGVLQLAEARKFLMLETIDGRAASESALGRELLQLGFTRTGKGFRFAPRSKRHDSALLSN